MFLYITIELLNLEPQYTEYRSGDLFALCLVCVVGSPDLNLGVVVQTHKLQGRGARNQVLASVWGGGKESSVYRACAQY